MHILRIGRLYGTINTYLFRIPYPHGTITACGVEDTTYSSSATPFYNVDTGRMSSQRILYSPCRWRPHSDGTIFWRWGKARSWGIAITMRMRTVRLRYSGDEMYIWMGSQASDVIHLVCPLRVSLIAFPVFGSHRRTCPSCPPLANFLSIGSHSTQRTHPLWPESVCEGVSVFKSHNRALVSPEPVAKSFPVGEKEAQRIGEECPGSRLAQYTISFHTIKPTWERRRTPSCRPDTENTLRRAVHNNSIFWGKFSRWMIQYVRFYGFSYNNSGGSSLTSIWQSYIEGERSRPFTLLLMFSQNELKAKAHIPQVINCLQGVPALLESHWQVC